MDAHDEFAVFADGAFFSVAKPETAAVDHGKSFRPARRYFAGDKALPFACADNAILFAKAEIKLGLDKGLARDASAPHRRSAGGEQEDERECQKQLFHAAKGKAAAGREQAPDVHIT